MKPAAGGHLLPDTLRAGWYNEEDFVPLSSRGRFEAGRIALILVDLVNWQAHSEGATIGFLRQAAAERADYLERRCAAQVIPNLKKLLPAARAAKVQVIHAKLASRHADFGDVVPALRPYARAAGAAEGSWATEVLAELGPDPADITIVKTGSGAFAGTDLDILLRRLGIRTLLYAGVVTNACVLLSVAAGFDLGYRQYLLSDCTAATSQRDQEDAERLIGDYLAEIVTAADVAAALAG